MTEECDSHVNRRKRQPQSLDVLWTLHCALEQLVTERRDADQKALELRADDYSRRFDNLDQTYEREHKRVGDQIATIRSLVYIGVGLGLALQIGLTIWSIVR